MSDRLALLEQRVADLEAECAGLSVLAFMFLETSINGTLMEDIETDTLVGWVSNRWPDVPEEEIRRISGSLLLLWGNRGKPRPE